jgi:pantetheine-phosphate adenylyltransferase
MARTAFYSGSFDPLTNGHLDVIERAVAFCDRLVVGIGANATKSGMFSTAERMAMIHAAAGLVVGKAGVALEAVVFSGLAVEAARQARADIIVRGLRDVADFDFEMRMAGMNLAMAPQLPTVFLPASPQVRHISATLVRQIAAMGGDASAFVPPNVASALAARFAAR